MNFIHSMMRQFCFKSILNTKLSNAERAVRHQLAWYITVLSLLLFPLLLFIIGHLYFLLRLNCETMNLSYDINKKMFNKLHLLEEELHKHIEESNKCNCDVVITNVTLKSFQMENE